MSEYNEGDHYQEGGFKVTVIEKSEPKLPTVFGSVIRGKWFGRDITAVRVDNDTLPWHTDPDLGDDVPTWLNGASLSDVEVLFDAGAVSA